MTTLPYEEQNILLHLGAHALADRTGATRDDAWEQMSRYLNEGKLTFHGNADGVYLSAAGHQLAEANRDIGAWRLCPPTITGSFKPSPSGQFSLFVSRPAETLPTSIGRAQVSNRGAQDRGCDRASERRVTTQLCGPTTSKPLVNAGCAANRQKHEPSHQRGT
jgi:hypothetical protein